MPTVKVSIMSRFAGVLLAAIAASILPTWLAIAQVIDLPQATAPATESSRFSSGQNVGIEFKSADVFSGKRARIRRVEDTLYGVADELPGVRIGWYIHDSMTAWKVAIDRKLPLVLLMHEDWCEFCWKMIDVFTCRSLNRFAGSAIFAVGSGEREISVKAMQESLQMDALPTLTIIRPEPSILVEEMRIEGYLKESELAAHLETARSNYPRSLENLADVPPWVLSPPGSQAGSMAIKLSKSPQYEGECR